jgi:hypothetical protein
MNEKQDSAVKSQKKRKSEEERLQPFIPASGF